jgi:hypothetical protein
MTYFEIISIVLAVIVIVATLYNIHLIVKTFKADHERRKKQATIEYAGQLLRECRFKIDTRYKFQTLTNHEITELKNNPTEEAELRNLLGAIEHMVIGIHTGVYDKDLLYRMSASYLISVFSRVKPYIEVVRIDFTSNAYTEFEKLVTEFEARKRGEVAVLNKGDIKYS